MSQGLQSTRKQEEEEEGIRCSFSSGAVMVIAFSLAIYKLCLKEAWSNCKCQLCTLASQVLPPAAATELLQPRSSKEVTRAFESIN